MSKIDLVPVTGAQNISAINDNFAKVAEALNDKALYRDNPEGEPNLMKNDLDMNGKRIYNLPAPIADHEPARKADLDAVSAVDKLLRVTDISIPPFPDAVDRRNKLVSFDNEGKPQVQFPSNDSATQLRIDLGQPTGTNIIGYKARSLEERLGDVVSVKDFGAVGDYVTDDTASIDSAIAWCVANNKNLFFPKGAYKYVGSLDKPAKVKFSGVGKPNFNITVGSDDKRFLRPGYKHLINGSSIIFTGTQNKFITTSRTDRFSSFGYMIKTEYFEPGQIDNMGFISDVDIYDAGGAITTYSTDNRASFDVGLVVDNGMDCKFHNLAIFGYFNKKKAIVIPVRNTDASNPDYNFFYDVTAFGGVALIGYETTPNQGLSGTLFAGCTLFDQTYHNRALTDPLDYVDQDVIFIDGLTGTNNAINGHKFIGGCIRSTCPVPIRLGRMKDLSIIGVTTECTLNGAYTGQTLQYITGTVNTDRITLQGNRMASWNLRLRALANEIGGVLNIDEDWAGKAFLTKAGKGISWGAPDQISNDPAIQLSDNFSSFTNKWNIRYSVANSELQVNYNGTNQFKISNTGDITPVGRVKKITGTGDRVSRTIASGVISAPDTTSNLAVIGEGSVADDLDNITGGLTGDILYLEAFSASQPITVKKNINLRINSDFTLGSINSVIVLQKTSSGFWREVSRSTNT